MCQVSSVEAFPILRKLSRLNAPTPNAWIVLAINPSYSSIEIALAPIQTQKFNNMSLMFNEPKTKFSFVITQDEAVKLIEHSYLGQLEIIKNKRFSD